ncbi:hypothetical protein [Pseudoduganella sp. UC29_71]|uniref:hypothetical protein n=1 Tax=Pseudoduganella sp. UC29_71 TaxID=3350174 RepID=UPI00366EE22E
MKKLLIAASLLAISLSAAAQNVSISVGQPGFYGRIDLGNMAPPPVIYAEPVIVHRPVRVIEEPLYLRVPPGHAKKWSKHCGAYNACGRRVYFVRDDWYVNDYAPRYRSEHGHRDHRDDRRDDHRDDHRDHRDKHDKHDKHDKGHGNGHGKGHGKD